MLEPVIVSQQRQLRCVFFSRVLLLLSNFVTKAVTGSLLIAD